MTCISITWKLTLSMIINQVVLLASKRKFFMDENRFFDRKVRGVVLPPGTVWTKCSQVAWTCLAFSKWSESTQIYSIVWSHSQTCLERIVFKESLVSVPRLINNTLIFLVLMLTALAIKLRWYAEVLSSSSQNWKTHPTISAKCSIQIKINLSSRFNMIWNGAHLKPEEEIQREQLHRNKARD